MTNIAIENGTLMVDLPIEHGDFPVRYVNSYQRVFIIFPSNITHMRTMVLEYVPTFAQKNIQFSS